MNRKNRIYLIAFILLSVFTLNLSCKKKTTTTKELAIGDTYQGGKIFYFLKSGDKGYDANVKHGLIAAPSDQSGGIKWYNGGSSWTELRVYDYYIGSGRANTDTIVAKQGNGSYAAKLCADLVLGGYSDWYLPSLNEIEQLSNNSVIVGSFVSGFYWCSTENDTQKAKAWKFSATKNGGYFGYDAKDALQPVRAIRSF